MSHTCEDKINNPIPDADLGLAYSLYTEWAKKIPVYFEALCRNQFLEQNIPN